MTPAAFIAAFAAGEETGINVERAKLIVELAKLIVEFVASESATVGTRRDLERDLACAIETRDQRWAMAKEQRERVYQAEKERDDLSKLLVEAAAKVVDLEARLAMMTEAAARNLVRGAEEEREAIVELLEKSVREWSACGCPTCRSSAVAVSAASVDVRRRGEPSQRCDEVSPAAESVPGPLQDPGPLVIP